jgi:RNA polymerase sigma factor (sigma-70 family)
LELNELITKAKSNDQFAFKSLLELFWNDVYMFLLNKTGNENNAEDLTLQTFSKAFNKIHQYNSDYPFKTWIISISRNLFIDNYRKNKKDILVLEDANSKEFLELTNEEQLNEDHLINEQNLANLLSAIKQLKPHYQKVIQLRFFQEYSYKEIAEELEEPINNIKVKLLRAKKLLLDSLNQIK